MDNQFKEHDVILNFSFLGHRDVQAHFADLNIALLSGRHIQTGEGYLFTLVNHYQDEFKIFYRSLYGLELKQAKVDNTNYYYLDFPEEGKGKLYTSDRFREMTSWEIIVALMLLNMYYERSFEQAKVINWEIIQKEIMESELAPLYKKAFFNNSIREFYTNSEWKVLFDKFKRVLRIFDRWGWIKLQTVEEGEFVFLIRESIDRFGKLYQYEISHFDIFIEQINQKK
ncbi:condensin complex protein MksE [Adhaeribacter soli]|uniref:DUF4194 domain-containing protein n=1 Tax=Adhaeribacter soli TaxID=2607655 RepID=A0A5N1J2D7_9BACT|nr:hypothetical protein [Adhaeribacter soli]KAA9338792.1 hypothetical protein F0P94_08320 [Adhaeribacter soli]